MSMTSEGKRFVVRCDRAFHRLVVAKAETEEVRLSELIRQFLQDWLAGKEVQRTET